MLFCDAKKKYKFCNEVKAYKHGDAHSERGGPARLPAQVAWRWDTQIGIVYGEEKNIFTGLTRAAKAG